MNRQTTTPGLFNLRTFEPSNLRTFEPCRLARPARRDAGDDARRVWADTEDQQHSRPRSLRLVLLRSLRWCGRATRPSHRPLGQHGSLPRDTCLLAPRHRRDRLSPSRHSPRSRSPRSSWPPRPPQPGIRDRAALHRRRSLITLRSRQRSDRGRGTRAHRRTSLLLHQDPQDSQGLRVEVEDGVAVELPRRRQPDARTPARQHPRLSLDVSAARKA